MLTKNEIAENLRKAKSNIQSAAKKAGVETNKVNLLAVSKTHPSSMIRWAYEEGQTEYGENYVQEAISKQEELSDLKIQWHFIGHLQSNKVKDIVGSFDLIHSVDSLSLLTKISQRAIHLNIQQKVLLQVNIASELTKGGFTPEFLLNHFSDCVGAPNIQLMGLMAMPPLCENPEDSRHFFKETRMLWTQLQALLPEGIRNQWIYLSMGTTNDYDIAIQEGANIIRIGTSIFGARE